VQPTPHDNSLRHILHYTLPLVGSSLVTYSFTIIDSLMIAPLGNTAFGGTGQGSLYFSLVCALFIGVLAMFTPLVARRVTKTPTELSICFWSGNLVAALFAVVAFALASVAGPVLEFCGQPASIVEVIVEFLNVLRWATLPMLVGICVSQLVNLCGFPAINLYSAIFGVLLNALLNWVFIFGHCGAPAMGVRGSALATVIARTAMVVFSLLLLQRRLGARRIELRKLSIDLSLIRAILVKGGPRGINHVSDWLITFALVLIIGQRGEISVVANNVGDVTSSTMYIVPGAFCQVATIFVARNLANEAPRQDIVALLKRLHIAALFSCAVVGVAVALAMPAILEFFALTPTSEAWPITRDILVVHIVFYASYLFQHSLLAVLDAFLDTRIPSIAMLAVSALGILPIALWVARHYSAAHVWVVEGIGVTALSFFYYVRLRRQLTQYAPSSAAEGGTRSHDGL